MGAIERAQADIESGNLGMAKTRLMSYYTNKPFDPDGLAHIARVLFRMGDYREAGKWYLLSSAENEESERAVDEFVRAVGNQIEHALGQLPQRHRCLDVGRLHPAAKRRIEHYWSMSCWDVLAAKRSKQYASPTSLKRLRNRVIAKGCALITVLFVLVLFAGVIRLFAIGFVYIFG